MKNLSRTAGLGIVLSCAVFALTASPTAAHARALDPLPNIAVLDMRALRETIDAAMSSAVNSQVNANSSTSGSSSASASVVNIISGSESGGGVHIEVRTESNGVVHEEAVDHAIPASGSLDVTLATSSGGSSVRSEVHISAQSTSSAASSTTGAFPAMQQSLLLWGAPAGAGLPAIDMSAVSAPADVTGAEPFGQFFRTLLGGLFGSLHLW